MLAKDLVSLYFGQKEEEEVKKEISFWVCLSFMYITGHRAVFLSSK